MCNWLHQEGNCVARAERANRAFGHCSDALDVIFSLEKQQRDQVDQLDLWQPPVDQAVIDFWWTVHAACGAEYRRVSKLFWTRCQHPYVYSYQRVMDMVAVNG